MGDKVTPPVTVGFLKAFLNQNDLSDDLVVTDCDGDPFHAVNVNTFDAPDPLGGQAVVALS